MRLYQNSAQELINDLNDNKLSDKLKQSFVAYYGHNPPQGEYNAWNNSFQFIKNELQENKLYDIYVIIEYELPYSARRIDVILMGCGTENIKNIIVVELKQWSSAKLSKIEGNIITYVGHQEREVLHPSEQVAGYYYYMKDFMEIFNRDNYELYGCSYCHNYSRSDKTLLDVSFNNVLAKFPLFTKDDFKKFGEYLKSKLLNGNGFDVYNDFITGDIKPSKKLVDYTSDILKNQKVFSLIDEQILANNTIIDRAKKAAILKHKSVIIVEGGPGTGKSVIALNAMAELLSKGYKVYHATGSKAFTSSLQKIVGSGEKNRPTDDIDVLIADEAHRIRKSSNSRYTRPEKRSALPQIEEMINAAKVSVFFIDEHQLVRPEEIGSIKLITEAAKKFGAEVHNFQLKTQFRCSGSDGYLNWIDPLLNINDTGNEFLSKNEKMEFKIVNSPQILMDEMNLRNSKDPNSARMVAGF